MESGAAGSSANNHEGSVLRGGPALLFTLGVLVAAYFAFAHRPVPPFPANTLPLDRALFTTVAGDNGHFVIAGALGHVLYSTSYKGPWEPAKVEPNRESTITRVRFINDTLVLGVGHDSWIIRSTDGGKTFKEVNFDPKASLPLMSVAGPYNGKLFAVGAFGSYYTSTDMGKSWTKQALVEKKPEPTAADKAADAAAAAPADDSGSVFPFANFTPDIGFSGFHLNDLTQADDGALVLVGERGLIARSTDNGASWLDVSPSYKGSFYGVLNLHGGHMLVYGMRGHAFYSADNGLTWQASQVPGENSLFAGTVLPSGAVMLVASDNKLYLSTDAGQHFQLVAQGDRRVISGVLGVGNDQVLTVGEGGLRLVNFGNNK